MPLDPEQLVFLGIVLGAYFVGTVLGFGTTILTVTFGAQLFPIEVLLPIVAPLNVALSSYLAIRHRKMILWRPLLRRVLPLVGIGVPVGLMLFNLKDADWLKLGFGVFVTIIASLQLRVSLRKSAATSSPLPKVVGGGLLAFGGVIHGLYNTAGLIIVYVLGREIEDKGEFRSTLAAMFVPLTAALVIDYAVVGLVTRQTVHLSAMCLVPILIGLVLGEMAHKRIDSVTFKKAVWVLLFVGGIILTVRGVYAVMA